MPATVMPVTPPIGSVIGHHDQMECARWDRPVAPGAQIVLSRLIGLHGCDGYVEKIAHAMSASIAAMATTIMTTSSAVLLCSRKGLNPTLKR